MASKSGEWGRDEEAEEQAGRWRRLGEMGMEAGLRSVGLSEASTAAVLEQVQAAGERIYQHFWEGGAIVSALAEIEDGRAALLAVLGRSSSSSVTELWLTQRSIGHLDTTEAIALCANVSSNPNIRVLALDEQTLFGTLEGCCLLADALSTNSSLKSLFLSKVNMGAAAAKRLVDGLHSAKTLEDLSLGYNPLEDEGIRSVAEMVSASASLKRLYLYETHGKGGGAEQMATALERNSSLEILYFGGNAIGKDGMKRLVAPLSRTYGAHRPRNCTLKELELSNITQFDFSVEAVAWMIRTNTGLTSLSLASTTLLTRDWVDEVFPALRENETLKELDLRSCQGLTMEGAYDALMALIQSSDTGLEDIELTGTGLEPTSALVEEELRINSEYQGGQRGHAQLSSTSGRLYLEFISGKAMFRTANEPKVHDTSGIDTGRPSKLTRPLLGLRRFLRWRACRFCCVCCSRSARDRY